MAQQASGYNQQAVSAGARAAFGQTLSGLGGTIFDMGKPAINTGSSTQDKTSTVFSKPIVFNTGSQNVLP